MAVKTKLLVLTMSIILSTLSHQVQASQTSKEFSEVIERFSVWKGQTEYTVSFCKSFSKVPRNEIPALQFMYNQVRVNVNSLIKRIVRDLKTEKGNIDSERYRDSLIKAQRSVSDFNDYIEESILPFIFDKKKEAVVKPTGPAAALGVIGGIASLVGATLAVLDYLEKRAKESEREKIIEALNGVKLKAFEQIRPLYIEKEE